MKKEYRNIEQLLTDEDFLDWYFDKRHSGQPFLEEDAGPDQHRLLKQAIRWMQDLHQLEEPKVSDRQVAAATRLLLQQIAVTEEQDHPSVNRRPSTNRRPPAKRKTLFLFQHNCRVAIRNLKKDKAFSAINIAGLGMGLAVCLLIALFVRDELSYDRYNKKADRIYRIHSDISTNGITGIYNNVPGPLGPTLAKDFPQVEAYTRLAGMHAILLKKGNTTIFEPMAGYADPSIFDIFTLPFVAGDPKTALAHPSGIVIAESIAKKYFGTANPLGKSLHIDNTRDYTVTGVMKDMPVQSHFRLNFIMAMSSGDFSDSAKWLDNSFLTYVLLRPGVSSASFDRDLAEVTQKYILPQAKGFNHLRYFSFPLTRIHLFSSLSNDPGQNGSIRYVYIFTIIAVFILLIACVNFMNLSTARSARRAKEVGIRKVLGSLRTGLIAQFLTESLLTSALAMGVALMIATLLLPFLNQLSGKQISLTTMSSLRLLPWLAVITVVVGLLAGIYPAFFLSAFLPVKVLKGRLTTGFRSGWLRNGLVVFQFTIAIVLVIGTLVIYRQLNYIRHKDVGYNRQQVLVISNTYSLWIHARRFKEDVERLPGVLGATMTFFLPAMGMDGSDIFFKDRGMTGPQSIALSDWPVDADYIPTMGMKIVKGRNFSHTLRTDSSAILINETAAKALGYPDPIGKDLYGPGDSGKINAYTIIGVVKDFHPGSLHNMIQPMMFNLREERGALAVRIRTDDIPGLLRQIEHAFRSWDKMADQPFPYGFLDEEFNQQYESEQSMGSLLTSFALFAIGIGCLGLFGLITYAAEQRTKEIGIRKVLGASARSIVSMLSKDFLRLVLLSSCIAFPIAGWMMNRWLQGFAYRTNIAWWIFAAAGLTAILITMATISFQAIRSALANPVRALRSE